jgi:hypothetical protein
MKNFNSRTMQVLALAMSTLAAQHAFAAKPGGSPGGSSVGIVTIDQDKAAAGGVTNGDAPGFPVTISVPGSYRLESNLTVPDTSTTVIEITAKDVTLDLNGFTVSGPNVCSAPFVCTFQGGGDGISSTAEHTTVFGGTVRGMGGFGIRLQQNAHVARVHVKHNGIHGISLKENSLLMDSTSESNSQFGILVRGGSLVLRNVSSSNQVGANFDASLSMTGSGANIFINNTTAFQGATKVVIPNTCYPSGC